MAHPHFILEVANKRETVVLEPQVQVVEVVARGPQGPPGGGGGGGSGNVFIQQENPNMTEPGMWWETDAAGELVTLWIEIG